jgi:tRNA U34 5-methylaminomethyl-2-thiouridine-forming methyltransferase MnmC
MRETLPQRRAGETFEFTFEGASFVATVGRLEDGRLAEVFLSSLKTSSLFDHLARDTGILLSIALQHGASFETLSKAMSRDGEGRPQGLAACALDEIAKAQK